MRSLFSFVLLIPNSGLTKISYLVIFVWGLAEFCTFGKVLQH
jgi:hypothetical protein